MPVHKKRKPLKVGSKFLKIYKMKAYTLTVVRKEGKIMYEVNNKIFTSPTAAAKSIVEYEINGWDFWKIK